jgi:CRISPR-associated protein Cmr1
MSTHKLQATLETVTPLFLGGSDPRGEPELRAASFRGAMRFWLRALLGGVLGDRPDKIFQCESQVFGSTDHASPVVVRLEPHNLGSDGFNPLPHKQVTFRFNGFKPGQRFDICLLSRDEDALQQAQKALQLLCYLGGLGRRSRRGFGSLQITDGELALMAKTAKELGNALKQRLDAILPSSFAKLSDVPRFPILHPNWAQIKVCDEEFSDWEQAIKFVMKRAHQHKNPALGFANPRQASPVHVHVTRLSTGKYAIVLTTMLSQLNPKLSGADPQKLVDFLNDFKGDVIFGEEVPKNWLGGSGK